jgi:Rieske Fe-S protein
MVSRRGFVKGTMLAGMGALTAASVATLKSLVVRSVTSQVGAVEDGFMYTSATKVLWFQPFLGRIVQASDFPGVGYGATTIWRGIFDEEGRLVPGSGSPALVMRVNPDEIIVPSDLDERVVTDDGFVAVFNICVHLCCNPAPRLENTVIEEPPPAEDVYVRGSLTEPVVDRDIGVIYCPCHHSTYDPLRLVWNTHPGGQRYLGANWVWGPAQRALPIIPLERQGDKLVGLNTHPEWYTGYCGL